MGAPPRTEGGSLSSPPAPKVLFVFLDGVGIGLDDPRVNPFFATELPGWARVAGGSLPHLDALLVSGVLAASFPLDATMGVPGTPQSGTGQAALLTGQDTVRLHGAHFGPWTPVALRPLVEERSVLRTAVEAGRSVAFANAYPRGWPGPRGGRRIAAPPLAARGAGVLHRHEEALAQGRAVSSEIVNDGWRRHPGHPHLPAVTPEEAGRNLARIAADHDLTLYAHYATDTAGHRGAMEGAVAALQRVDAFLAGLVDALDAETLLLVASDHGNVEDVRGGHTTNPALGMARGPGAGAASELRDIRQVAGFVLERLGIGG